jgi:hypothetical protein
VATAAAPKGHHANGSHLKIGALAVAVAIAVIAGTFALVRRPSTAASTVLEDAPQSSRSASCVAAVAVPIEQWIGRPPGIWLPASRIAIGANLSAVAAPITFCDENREIERRAVVRTVDSGGAIVALNWFLTASAGATRCYTASNRYVARRDPFGGVTAYELTATWLHGVIARSAAGEVITTGEVSRWCQVNVGPAYRSRTKD